MIACYKNKSLGFLILRLFVGVIFMIHGILKFENMADTITFFTQIGLSSFWAYVVASVETLGGLAFILGIFVQYAGYLLTIVMLVAITMVKYKFGGPTLLAKFAAGEVDLALLGSILALTFTGPGRYSLSKWCKCHKDGGNCKVCDVMGCDHHDSKKA